MKRISVLVLLFLITLTGSLKTMASSTGIIGPDVIHKQQNHIVTIADILGLYRSSLGQVQVILDEYTGYGNIVGPHAITLQATDGETTVTKDLTVIVIPELGNVIAVSDYKNIHVKKTEVLTPGEIIYILSNTGHIEITATTQMMILSNTYTGNEGTVGQYVFEFRLVNSAGVDLIETVYVYVTEDTNMFIPDIIFVPPQSDLSKILNLFITLAVLGAFGFIMYKGYKIVTKKNKKKVIT